jgi:hypothetical protein
MNANNEAPEPASVLDDLTDKQDKWVRTATCHVYKRVYIRICIILGAKWCGSIAGKDSSFVKEQFSYNIHPMPITIYGKKCKAVPIWGREGQYGWDVEAPIFSLDNGLTVAVRLSALRAGRSLHSMKIFWYLFLIEAESTPGPECGQKDWVNWKHPPHRDSNPQPSSL